MRKELKVYTGILVFALMCAAGWIVADSSLTWSDPNGQCGTFKLDGVIVSNSTVYGNCSGGTNVNAANISQGNLSVARITNAAATLGSSIGGNIPVEAVTNAIKGWTGISTNSMILFITNGIVKNSIAP